MTRKKKEKPMMPLVLAYGGGRDSTAILVGWHMKGIRPDYIVMADVGSEKPETYAYWDVIRPWLKKVGFPDLTIVKYTPPLAPYDTIEGNCTQNCTLPSEVFGRGACTLKWKIGPQNKWAKNEPGLAHIFSSKDLKITKAIGYEAEEQSRKDKMEKAKKKLLEQQKLASKTAKKHESLAADKHYDYVYPLIEWGWTLEECKARIAEAGLPVPPKSSCFFCPNMRPEEVRQLNPDQLGRIMRMEIAAEPYNQKVYGLWRKDRKYDGRPGSMTEFILKEGLEYVHPDDLPDEMPRNPKCGKAQRGYTFLPPHRDINLKTLVDEHHRRKDEPDLFDMIEDKSHAEIIDSI